MKEKRTDTNEAYTLLKSNLIKTLDKNDHNTDIYDAVGVHKPENERSELLNSIQEEVNASRKRTNIIRTALNKSNNFNEFAALLLIIASADAKATVQAETRMKMKLFEAITK